MRQQTGGRAGARAGCGSQQPRQPHAAGSSAAPPWPLPPWLPLLPWAPLLPPYCASPRSR